MTATFTSSDEGNGHLAGQFFHAWSDQAAEYMREHRFKKVMFEGSWGDMTFLSEFADCIEEIVISNDDLRADGVAELTGLVALNVRHKVKRPIDFARLTELRRCIVRWHPSYSNDLFALQKLDLVYLFNFESEDFSQIAANSSVARMRLSAPRLTSFAGIGNLSGLQSITIQKGTLIEGFDGLSELSNLTSLEVEGSKKVASCDGLRHLPSVEFLRLSEVGGASTTAFARQLNRLTGLQILGIPVEPDWGKLVSLTSLTKLDLLVREDHVPSHDELDQLAAGAGKRVLTLETIGLKKRPIVRVELARS